MPAPRSPRRVRLAALVSVALAFTGLQLFAAPVAQAASTTVVISEVFGGNGTSPNLYNQDFVELHNISGGTVSLTGMSVQYRSATSGTGASSAVNLTGSIPAGGYYLVGGAVTAGGTAIPTPDASNTTMNLSGIAGVVILANTTASNLLTNAQIGAGPSITGTPGSNALIQDLVGYGLTPDRYETNRAPAPSTTTVIKRTAADNDDNSAEFTASATGDPTPAGTAALSLTNPGPQTSTVGVAISTLQLAASGGTIPYTYGATGLPPGLNINTGNGQITGTPNTTAGSPFSVTVSVTDSAGAPATDNKNFTWTVNPAPSVIPIKDIQGTGATTPLNGQVVSTQGVVTASYSTGGLNGFYIQTPGADTATASDGIFVFGGSGGFTTYPAIGASVDVIGTAGEFSGQTQITTNDAGVTPHGSSLGTVTPKTQIPGTNCALPGSACDSGATLDAAREVAEGEAFQPTAPWVLTDVFDGGPYYTAGSNSSSMFGEMGVAADSAKPLVAPTELYDNLDANVANRKNYNDAHRIILDDASSLNYTAAANTGSPFPWMTAGHVPRVGAAVTFPAPVIFTFGFNAWRIEPTTQVVGAPSGTQPQFAQTRAANAAPQNVGGDIKLATFNVLNFFPTTGNEFVSSALGTCTYFTDRQGNQITNNSCNPNGPRGAANAANLTRQRDKIVAAINTANADIVSLEELENSIFYNKPRDFAIGELVTALNAASSPGKWAFVPSPAPADLPAQADQDVIRNGFIYQPANVATVGASRVLTGESSGTQTWANGREPLAQAFKKAGTSNSQAFAVIVNHFKSKSSGVNDGTGQGNANPDRVAQASSLVTFANQFQLDRGLNKVFLVGDFNAYTHEDPIQVLTGAGYTVVDSTSDPDEESYNFDGQVGSLDHVLANPAALADVSGADVWQINAYESVYYEYSRFNYNVTNLYAANPFRSSDHNPELVGINVPQQVVSAPNRTIQYGQTVSVPVTVTGSGGTPSGTVELLDGTTSLGSATLSGGSATITVPRLAVLPGTHTITVRYLGEGSDHPVDGAMTLTVEQSASSVDATVVPKKPKVGKKVKVQISVHGDNGVAPTGLVTVIIKGGTAFTATLVNGTATINIGKFDKKGQKLITVQYLGNVGLDVSQTMIPFQVKKR